MGEFYDHPNKHIAHEVREWVQNCEKRSGSEHVAKENELRFADVTATEVICKKTRQILKVEYFKNAGVCLGISAKWDGDGLLSRQPLEEMFHHYLRNSKRENDETITYEYFYEMPETLHLVFNRTREIDERDDSGNLVRKRVQITRPIDVPHKIDFSTGGFLKAVYPSRRKECAKKYRLAGAVVGKLLNPEKGDQYTMMWWGYIYNPVEGQWYVIPAESGCGRPVETAYVHKYCNGVDQDGTRTGTFPLRLYYHEERDLAAVFASAPAPNSDEKFFNYAQLLGHTKLPAALRQAKPPVITGRSAFDAYYTRILVDYCEGKSVNLVTREDLHALLSRVNDVWQKMDLRERCKWINNACRINAPNRNLTKFNGMTARELFKEQWILTMINCSSNSAPKTMMKRCRERRSSRAAWHGSKTRPTLPTCGT